VFGVVYLYSARNVTYEYLRCRYPCNEAGSTVETLQNFCTAFDKTVCRYRGADKSLERHTSRCILFDGENISSDASPVIYI
jgi:hypothetical protein